MVAGQCVFQSAQRIAARSPVGTTQADHGHAVVTVGAGLPVVHAVAAPAERAVAETAWQLQQRHAVALVGHRCERALAAGDRDRPRGR
ncbi:hypothetical protein A7D16_16145 [Xanthomonas nasturtii]|nr:hypothetical protein A7D16_16145 [Xanthomonas nasturtii]